MSKKVYLFYPYEGPTTSIILRQPNFGDADNVNLQVQIKHSRNGNVFSFKRTPTYQTLKLTFEKMRKDPLQGFSGLEQIKTFLNTCAAAKIRYIDHNHDNWSGLITNPTVEFANQGRDSYGDLFGFSLELEVQRI